MSAIYIAAAVPFFFLLMGVECVVARWQKRDLYRLHDAIASIACGIVQQMSGLFLGLFVVGVYAWLFEHARFETISMGPWAWLVLMLLVDHQYYWFHRVSHRVNFVWATHVVHHQSEEYNLSTALRQSAFQGVMSAPFYWPLALMGFPALEFVGAVTINTLYQFWIHTQTIRRMGLLENVLNTPSHHRVHHGIDPQYIDKNYAGMLIVWDRLYGTYEPEGAKVNYGTVTPLSSWNPVWANFAYYAEIANKIKASQGVREKLFALIAPPEWRPRAQGGPVTVPVVDGNKRVLYATQASAQLNVYISLQFAVISAVVVGMLLKHESMALWAKGGAVLWVIVSLTSILGLVEKRRWAKPLEIVRLAAMVAVAGFVATPSAEAASSETAKIIVSGGFKECKTGKTTEGCKMPDMTDARELIINLKKTPDEEGSEAEMFQGAQSTEFKASDGTKCIVKVSVSKETELGAKSSMYTVTFVMNGAEAVLRTDALRNLNQFRWQGTPVTKNGREFTAMIFAGPK